MVKDTLPHLKKQLFFDLLSSDLNPPPDGALAGHLRHIDQPDDQLDSY